MDMDEVKVLVPTERVPEFYRWFADWLDRTAPNGASSSNHDIEPVDEEARLEAATRWWNSLKRSERGIWGMWIDAAPQMVSAASIVTELGLKGPRDIPGILSWSNRKGQRVGFEVDWRFRSDPVTGLPVYGIENSEYADLLRRARDAS